MGGIPGGLSVLKFLGQSEHAYQIYDQSNTCTDLVTSNKYSLQPAMMDAHAFACARGQVVTSAMYLKKLEPRMGCLTLSPRVSDDHDTQRPTQNGSKVVQHTTCQGATGAARVLTIPELFLTITLYQKGIFRHLRQIWTTGHWAAMFCPTEFVAMHLGPHGRMREAILHCIVLNRINYIQQLFRCDSFYPESDYRYIELIDAAFALGRIDIGEYLIQMKPGSQCTSRAVDIAAGNGHLHVVKYLIKHQRCQGTAYGIQKARLNNYPLIVEYLLRN